MMLVIMKGNMKMGIYIPKENPLKTLKTFDPVAERIAKRRAEQMARVRRAYTAAKEAGKPTVTLTDIKDAVAISGWDVPSKATYDELIMHAEERCRHTGGVRKFYGVRPDAPKETLIEAIRANAMLLIRGAVGLGNNAPDAQAAAALKKTGLDIAG